MASKKKQSGAAAKAAARDAEKAKKAAAKLAEKVKKDAVKAKEKAKKEAAKAKEKAKKDAAKAKQKAKKEAAKAREKAKAAKKADGPTKPDRATKEPVEPTTKPVVEPEEPAADLPNADWTVTALRAAARAQGIPGYSRLPKAELLARLSATE